MPKRRTKKQKQNTKYTFATRLLNEAKISNFEPVVKGQFKKDKKASSGRTGASKNAEPSAKDIYQSYIGRDIKRSLIIVSLILALEVMVYLVLL